MKQLLVAIAFVGIIGSLASALLFMMKGGRPQADEADDPRRASRMAWALALRVGLSVVLFLCILMAWKLGYIQPSGVPAGS